MVDGLWQGPTALTLDYVNVVRRIKLLGFNAVRLPFSMQVDIDVARLMLAHPLLTNEPSSLTGSTAHGMPCHPPVHIWQVLFGADPAGSIAAACPVFPDVNSNPTSADILASVTHPSTQLPIGTLHKCSCIPATACLVLRCWLLRANWLSVHTSLYDLRSAVHVSNVAVSRTRGGRCGGHIGRQTDMGAA